MRVKIPSVGIFQGIFTVQSVSSDFHVDQSCESRRFLAEMISLEDLGPRVMGQVFYCEEPWALPSIVVLYSILSAI